MQLPQGVPVYLTYITAQVRDGQITYLPDPYSWVFDAARAGRRRPRNSGFAEPLAMGPQRRQDLADRAAGSASTVEPPAGEPIAPALAPTTC